MAGVRAQGNRSHLQQSGQRLEQQYGPEGPKRFGLLPRWKRDRLEGRWAAYAREGDGHHDCDHFRQT
eukprot:4035199-Lingulodinium_polyedra.AAC.1